MKLHPVRTLCTEVEPLPLWTGQMGWTRQGQKADCGMEKAANVSRKARRSALDAGYQ
eukprot:SAG31_NODE_558_length_14153_cov_9.068094_15_plen_57_part_00